MKQSCNQNFFGLIIYVTLITFRMASGQYGPSSSVVSAAAPSTSSSDSYGSSSSSRSTDGSNSYGQIIVQLQPSTSAPMTSMMSGTNSLMATTNMPTTMPSSLTYDVSSSGTNAYGSHSRATDAPNTYGSSNSGLSSSSSNNNYMMASSPNQMATQHTYGQPQQTSMFMSQPSSSYSSQPFPSSSSSSSSLPFPSSSWNTMPFGQVSAYAPTTTTMQSTSLPVVMVQASSPTSYGSSPTTSAMTSSYSAPAVSSYSYDPATTTTTTTSLLYSQYKSSSSYGSSSYTSPTYSYGSYGAPTSARLVNYNRDTTNGYGPYVWDNLKNPLTAQEIQTIMASAIPGIDFPTLSVVPNTSFTCAGRPPGFYADPQAQCQAFHRCTPQGAEYSFLCPNMTLFNQLVLVCDWWFNVDCTRAEQFYNFANPRIYQQDMPLHDTPPPSYVAANIQDYFNRQLKFTGGVYGTSSNNGANMRHARQLLSSSYYPAAGNNVAPSTYNNYGQLNAAAAQDTTPRQYQMMPSTSTLSPAWNQAANTFSTPTNLFTNNNPQQWGTSPVQPQQRFFDSNSGVQRQQNGAFGGSGLNNNNMQTGLFANNLGAGPTTTTTMAPAFQTNAQLPQYYWQL